MFNDKTENKKKLQSGFTLVEVLVTLVIIGLMATIIVITVIPMMSKAKSQKAGIDIARLEQAIEFYYLETSRYPEKLEELLPNQSNNDLVRSDGYIKSLPLDPWNNPYNYKYPGDNGVYDLWSWGADGKQGGDGENADIGNWDIK